MKIRKYTKADDKFIKENYLQLTNSQIGKVLNRSSQGIAGRLNRLGLTRPTEHKHCRANSGCYKKGNVPWNKDVKGIHLSPESEFKPGNKPSCTKYDGAITYRRKKGKSSKKIPYIRVSEGVWIPLSRYLWEQDNGEIPDGKLVRCEGDEVKEENLILIDRKENLNLNRNPEKAGESLKKRWDEDHHLESDRFIAFTIAPFDADMRTTVINQQEIIKLKRLELKLKRGIKRHEDKSG